MTPLAACYTLVGNDITSTHTQILLLYLEEEVKIPWPSLFASMVLQLVVKVQSRGHLDPSLNILKNINHS